MKIGALLLASALLLAACGEKPAEKKGAPPTLITITEAKAVALEVSERTLGSLEAVDDPKIGAEIAGKIVKIAVRAGEAVVRGQLLARIDPTDAAYQASADNAEIAINPRSRSAVLRVAEKIGPMHMDVRVPRAQDAQERP